MPRTKHRIGRFRVIAPIGAGGFSTVYRALDESSGEEVAIKVLAENHSLVRETRRRFADEFNLMSAIQSPAIARIYEVGETENNQPFMVLELANRGDLRRRVEEFRRSQQVLNRADLMMLANHLAEALGTLHDADIVHRDVSPGNILIRNRHSAAARRGSPERGEVTLLEPGERFLMADLGHAKDLVLASGFTAGGGTRGFAAPEQLDDVTVVDRRADIFSATAIIEWAAHDGRFADSLEAFFDVGLASEPDERFDTMAQWHAALAAALGSSNDRAPRSRFGRRPPFSPADPVSDDRAESRISPAVEAARTGGNESGGGRRRPKTARLAAMVAALAVAASAALIMRYSFDVGPFGSGDGSEALDADDPSSNTSSPSELDRTDPEPPSTTVEAGGGTLVVPSTGTQPGGRPWAAIDTPMDGEVVGGNLIISGTAEFHLGIDHVELTIERLADNMWWNAQIGGFGPELTRTVVETSAIDSVDGRPVKGDFEAVVPSTAMEPGDYEVQIWARGLNHEGPAEPAVRLVQVP